MKCVVWGQRSGYELRGEMLVPNSLHRSESEMSHLQTDRSIVSWDRREPGVGKGAVGLTVPMGCGNTGSLGPARSVATKPWRL